MLMNTVQAIVDATATSSREEGSTDPPSDECIICMDRKSDVLLSCTHAFCCPCIEQWKVQHSSCPVCQEQIDDDWVLSETPNADEINEQICTELIKLSKVVEDTPTSTTTNA